MIYVKSKKQSKISIRNSHRTLIIHGDKRFSPERKSGCNERHRSTSIYD